MKKFLQQLLLFSLLFWIINSVGAILLAPRVKLDVGDKYHWLLRKEGEHYDSVFVGSSRVMNSVDPIVVDRYCGGRSINIGFGGSGAADQFLVIQQFLERNTAEVVYLQLDWPSLATEYFTYPFRDYIWLCYDDDEVVRRTILEERGQFRCLLWRIMPFLRLMEFSSQYRFFLREPAPSDAVYSETRGYVAFHGHNTKADSRVHVFKKCESCVNYLHRIIELCRERDISVVCFQSPYSSEEERRVDRRLADAAVSEFVRSEGVSFWDFSRALYDSAELFFDSAHLNNDGVEVFSRILGERIAAERGVPGVLSPAWRAR